MSNPWLPQQRPEMIHLWSLRSLDYMITQVNNFSLWQKGRDSCLSLQRGRRTVTHTTPVTVVIGMILTVVIGMILSKRFLTQNVKQLRLISVLWFVIDLFSLKFLTPFSFFINRLSRLDWFPILKFIDILLDYLFYLYYKSREGQW